MESNRFRDHSVWVWVGGVVVLLLLVAGIVGAKPIWTWSKQRRAETFLIQFREADQAGKLDAASAALRSAFFLAPNYPPVAREVAHFYSRSGLPEALNLWRELGAVSPLTLEDQLAYARVALELDRFDIAVPLMLQLITNSPSSPGVLPLAAEIAQRRGDPDAAVRLANEALNRDPANTTNLWLLANLQLRHPDPNVQSSGRQRLMAMAAGSSPERIKAVQLLLSSRPLPAADVNLLLRLLPERPEATFEERLARLGLENLSDPSGRVARVQALAQPLWNPEGRSNLLAAVSWFGQLGEYQDVLILVPEEQALTDSRLYLNRAGALGELERWSEVESLLANPKAPEMPLLQQILRASAAHAAGRTNESLGHWQQALTLADTDRAMLLSIARLAEVRGYTQVALDAWRPLLGDPRVAPRAAAEVLRLASISRNLSATRDALRRLDQLGAISHAQRITYALYDALLNQDLTRTQSLLSRSGAKAGDTNQLAVVRALVALRQNDPDLAAKELDVLTVDWSRVPVLWQVVRVAQLGRVGRRVEARELAEGLEVAELSAPERALVDPWLPNR
ncbi:MAG: hypothetical protein J0M24_18650 [Verrucomicrobia bacterium]|nr:hypothetical protein [Verrucomicrobiota bacterium]